VLPAFAWGFLHSNYPQEPPYIRGIEVGCIGIVAGLVMLRWGIVATLAWHYTVDAFLISMSLMRSADWYNRISGTIVGFGAFIPVGIAGVLYLARGGFADQTALLNGAEPLTEAVAAPEEAEPERAASRYEPLTASKLALLALVGVVGVALVWAVRPAGIGSFVRFSIDGREAQARADIVLQQRGVDPAGYRRAATIQERFDPMVNEFLRRSLGVQGANQIYRRVPSAYWTVRYFRDSQAEEYLVVLLPDGALHSVHHTLAEAAPGPGLNKEHAQAKAETYLREGKGLDLAQWKLVEASSAKLPARTDHSFTWEQIAPLTPEDAPEEVAHERVQLQVLGDEVSDYRVFVHVPEEWTRQQEQTTLADTLQLIGRLSLAAALVVGILVAFFRNLRQPLMTAVPWRTLAAWSLIVLAAAIAAAATQIPQYLANYKTQLPFQAFVATTLIGLSLGTMMSYAGVVFLFGLAWFFLAKAYGPEHLPGFRGMPAAYYRDAFAIGVGGALALVALDRAANWTAQAWNEPQREFAARLPTQLDFLLPAVHATGAALLFTCVAMGLLALMLGFTSSYVPRPWMQGIALAACAILLAPQWASAGDFAEKTLTLFVELAVIWWGAQRVARFNLLGYLLAALLVLLAGPAADLIAQPNSFFHVNGWALVALVAVLLLWPLAIWRLKSAARTQEAASIV
jgi:hypothetical protein